MTANDPLIPKHGGYRRLKSFQVAQLIYAVSYTHLTLPTKRIV